MSRKLEDWIDAFETLTEFSGSPARLRRWAAISCIAGALERKVWVHTAGSNLYPNLYILLVAPPGIGKSRVLSTVFNFWNELLDHHTAPSSVTKASLIDELNDAHRTIIRLGHTPSSVEFHSLKVLSSELGVLIPEFGNEFMNTLTDLYDGYPYSERRRTRNVNIQIPKPQLNLVAGTTPNYLGALIPEGAWDQGFMSRVMMIFGAEKKLFSMFAHTTLDKGLREKMMADLTEIGEAYGEIKFTPEAAEFFDAWYLGGQQPVPEHPKLQNYATRRPAHLLKLSQIALFSSSTDFVIGIEHVQRAMDWMTDAEVAMGDIFKSMAAGGDGRVMEECWHFLFQYKARFKKGAPEALVVRFLSQKVPSHSVERMLLLMDKAGMVRTVAVKGEGMLYEPKEKTIL